ncbi:MAG TPA: response regulator transcription factor [Candidatus Limnocylindria bacterium]|nr:response regulator transcription factor [Candidatus Limnocylindria bacterium]
MIRLLIADDHAVVREGLSRIFGEVPDLEVVAEAASGDDVLAAVAQNQVDVVLLDISMPGLPFLQLLRDLETHHPEARVLVLSMHSEDQYAVRAFRAGAAGYVTKDRSPEEILDAIRTVHRGARYVSHAVEKRLVSRGSGLRRLPHETLSDREYEVLCLLGAGTSLKDIAARLTLSPKTVSTYRSRIMEKMAFHSNADIVRYVIEQRLSG